MLGERSRAYQTYRGDERMSELLYKEMSKDKIIKSLQELKTMWRSKSPSKYYFALGHAVRLFEADASQQTVALDTGFTCGCGNPVAKGSVCSGCGGEFH